jgi:hypothetical protein
VHTAWDSVADVNQNSATFIYLINEEAQLKLNSDATTDVEDKSYLFLTWACCTSQSL